MKRAILLILALAGGVFSQQRDVRSTMPLPSPSSAGTVTLSLAEYNRLSELATKKPKELKTAPQPSRGQLNKAIQWQRDSDAITRVGLLSRFGLLCMALVPWDADWEPC
jgi:hypothetical protein